MIDQLKGFISQFTKPASTNNSEIKKPGSETTATTTSVSSSSSSSEVSIFAQSWDYVRSAYLQTSDKKAEQAERKLLSRVECLKGLDENNSDTSSNSRGSVDGIVATLGDVDIGDGRYIHTLYLEKLTPNNNSNPKKYCQVQKTQQKGNTAQLITTADTQNQESGSGPSSSDNGGIRNLVITHGYANGLGNFYRNYDALSSHLTNWRIFAIDWLGMGRSSRPPFLPMDEPTEQQRITESENFFVESLEDWRKRMGLEKMTLLGHSLGGYLCAVYSLRYPQRVDKLIMVSPAGIPEPDYALLERIKQGKFKTPQQQKDDEEAERLSQNPNDKPNNRQAEYDINKETKGIPHTRRLVLSTVMYLWDKNYSPQSVVRVCGPFGINVVNKFVSRFTWLDHYNQADLANYMYHIAALRGSGEYAIGTLFMPGLFARSPLIRRFGDLKVPTTFMYGAHDWMDYKAGQEARRSMSPDIQTKLFRVPNAGHNIHMENPGEFNRIVINELKDKKEDASLESSLS
ncbi:hypothetical protein H4219_003689 [Mycoemilia scoparia]|uniref:AB hydrolase-1 domain-containing protein n=1 Tax=Mycoemilia scoparia TaxID=417184 RepID=A0A9W7ZU29_9FUNG|nr:hypothetical protein H4219_003689 [Mycoemilia scoparia]